MKAVLLVSALTLSVNLVMAQGYVFRVLANKGENTVKSGSEWKPVKTGSTLNMSDELKVSNGSYLGLIHKSGKTLELKTAGDYKVNQLMANLNSNNSSVASKYADFIMSKMSDDTKSHRLSVTGAVERSTLKEAIKVYIPSSVEVLNPETLVRWTNVKGATYEVTFKNMFDETIAVAETNEPVLNLNLDDPALATERLVILNVKVKGDENLKSGDYGIKRMSDEDAVQIKKNLVELQEMAKEETALNKLILASFYEENGLIMDALTNYEYAIQLSPDVDAFRLAYDEFAARNGLIKN
ncbi:MAG: hypothetical protein HC842_02030 [Cytophagales bacterium]|nr:hypothetical protein [Cytophagales bacterium]